MENTIETNPGDERNDTTKVVWFSDRWYSREEVNESMALMYAQELSSSSRDTSIRDIVDYHDIGTDTMVVSFILIEEVVHGKRHGSMIHGYFKGYTHSCDGESCPRQGEFLYVDLSKYDYLVTSGYRASGMLSNIREFSAILDIAGISKSHECLVIACHQCVINMMNSLGAEQLDVRNRSHCNFHSGRDAGRSSKPSALFFSVKKRILRVKKANDLALVNNHQ